MSPTHVTAATLGKEFRTEAAGYRKKASQGGDGARLWTLKAERCEVMAQVVAAVIDRDRDGETAAINRRIANLEAQVIQLEHSIRCIEEIS